MLGLLINNGLSKTLSLNSLHIFTTDSNNTFTSTDTLSKDSIIIDEIANGAPSFEVKYTAKDSINFDNTNQIVYLFGEAKVDYGDISLKADRIKVFIKKNEVHAFCKRDSLTEKILEKVVFTDNGESFEAPEMKYNFNTKKGRIIQATTQEGEMYLHSEVGKKMPDNEIFLNRGKLTTCDHDHPHFYFESRKLKVIPGKKIVAGPTNLIIRELRTPLWLPFGIFPNNPKKQSGILIPGYDNYNNSFGLMNLGYHWAINDFLHAEVLSSLYFSGRVLLSTDLIYKKRYKYNGKFSFNYTKDVKGTPDLSDYSESRNFNLKLIYNQDRKKHPKSTLQSNIDYRSPTFNQTQIINSSTIVSTVSAQSRSQLSWRWNEPGKWNLTTSANLTQNFSQNKINMSFPNLNLSVDPITRGIFRFAGNIEAKNEVSAGDSTFFTLNTLEDFRNGAKSNVNFNVISNQISVLRYLKLTLPKVDWNSYLITEEISKRQDENGISTDTINILKYAYDLSLRNIGVNTKIYGTYKFKDKYYVKGFRHTITPSVNLTYQPDFFIDAQNINKSVFDTVTNKDIEYSRYSTAMYRPNARKAASINFKLDQSLQSKIRDNSDSTGLKNKKINIITAFILGCNYNFLSDSLNWGDLNLNINTAPAFLKSLIIEGSLSPYAIDEDGRKYNKLLWKDGEIGRLTYFNIITKLSLNRNSLSKWIFNLEDVPNDDFKWNANITYQFQYNKQAFDATVNESFGVTGDVQISKKTKFSYNLPINIKTKKFGNSGSFNIKRDLHCWEMTLGYRPFMDKLNFSFLIQPKASMLRDLKFDKNFNER